MKMKFLLLSLSAVAMMTSCGSAKKAGEAISSNQDVEIVVPCSGIEFTTSAEYFRATSVGASNNLEIANQKAMTAARAKLAASIETTIKSVTDSYVSSYEENQTEESRSRYQALTREAVAQTLSGIRTICQKTTQSTNGQYRVYVAIELAGLDIAGSISDKVSDDSKLRTDFEYSKFLEIFNAEMAQLGNN